MYDWQRVVRTAQTYFPGLADLKYRLQHQKRQLLRQPFERDFIVLAHFRPEASADFLDVGANRAQTVQAIRLYNSANPISCFEPSELAYRELRRYTRGVSGVSLFQVGLGAEDGELTLYTPVYRGYVFDGLASVVRSEAADWLADRILRFDPRKLEIHEQVIRIETLDQQNTRPAFIKIDVQGAELDVLRGGRDTIGESRPLILLEAPHENRETAFLNDLGYTAYSYVDQRLRRGVRGTVNAFFVPAERIDQLRSVIVEP